MKISKRKNIIMNRYVLILVLLLCGISLQAQSPWTQEKGGGFGQLSFMAIPTYNTFFAKDLKDMSRTSDREYMELSVQAYAEYGILDKTTIILDAPIKILSAGESDIDTLLNEVGTLVGPGNIRLAVRQSILSDGVQLAGQLLAELPTGRYDDATGLRTGYDAFTILPGLSVGGGLGKGYIYGYGGIGFRTNKYSTYWNAGIEGGYNPFEPFWAMLFFDVIQSFEDGNRADPISNRLSGFYVNDQAWASLGLKLLYNINDNIGLTLSTTLAAFAANEVPQSPSVAIGVFTEW